MDNKILGVFDDYQANSIVDKKIKEGICIFYKSPKKYLENDGCYLKVFYPKEKYQKFFGPIFHLCGKHLRKIKKEFMIDLISDGTEWLKNKGYDKTTSHLFKCLEKENYTGLSDFFINANKIDFNLKKSIEEEFINKSKMEKFYDSEMTFWDNIFHFIGLPFELLNDFEFNEFIGNDSKSQGKNNGPDYIFKNIKEECIGLEIVEMIKLNYDTFRNKDILKIKTFETLEEFNSFEDILKEAKNTLNKKEQKLKTYKKTDKIYLGIVVPQIIMEYQYLLLELLLNKETKFDGVFIL